MSMPELLVVTIEYVQLVAISIAPYYSCLATMSSRVPIVRLLRDKKTRPGTMVR